MGVEAVIATQVIDTTTVGRSLMTAADAAAARTALSLGTLATQNGTISDYLTVATAASTYQVVLVSGTNIKTVNSTSLLGSGDITVSASPAGSSGQVQYNNAGAFGGMTAVVYAGSGTLLTVTSQAASDIALLVKGAASQTGNLLESRNSSNTLGARITSAMEFANTAGGNDSQRFGTGASTGDYSVAFGTNSIAASNFGVMVGSRGYAGMNCVAIGYNAGTSSTSGGIPASHAFSNTIVISDGFTFAPPTASNQCLIAGLFTDVFFGKLQTHATPVNVRMQGTGGSGTNIAGSTIRWAPGRSTGNATPASFIVQRTVAGSSGTTAQTLSDAVQVDGNTTAGETPLLLLDIDKGTLQRVSIGASDSGGTGFKVLRVPN